MYLAALHKILTQTVDLSQILAKCVRQKQRQMIRSNTKEWDKNTIKYLEQFCPKQDHDLFSTFWSSMTIL